MLLAGDNLMGRTDPASGCSVGFVSTSQLCHARAAVRGGDAIRETEQNARSIVRRSYWQTTDRKRPVRAGGGVSRGPIQTALTSDRPEGF